MDRFLFLLSKASAGPELYISADPPSTAPLALTERPGDRTSRSPTFACSRSHPAALIRIGSLQERNGESPSSIATTSVVQEGRKSLCVFNTVLGGVGGCSLCLSEQEKLLRKQELDHLQSCSRIWSLSFTDSCLQPPNGTRKASLIESFFFCLFFNRVHLLPFLELG